MKKGCGVTQEFRFEVTKLGKDLGILRVCHEKFDTETKIGILDKVRHPCCKLNKAMTCGGNCYVQVSFVLNTAWKETK